MHLDAEKEMLSQCVALLGKFIAVREPNIRYLGLVCALSFLLNLMHLYAVALKTLSPFANLVVSLTSMVIGDLYP